MMGPPAPAEAEAEPAEVAQPLQPSPAKLQSLDQYSSGSADRDIVVTVYKRQGDVLGASLGNMNEGAVILFVREDGLLDGWNRAHPDQLLHTGLIITEVNGTTGYWTMLEEIGSAGQLTMKVSTSPPENAGDGWFQEIADIASSCKFAADSRCVQLRLEPEDPDGNSDAFSSLPTVQAGECGTDRCSICFEDVGPEEQLAQLPCKHAFHVLCAARWLVQPRNSQPQVRGQRCPLCCRKVVSMAGGGIGTA